MKTESKRILEKIKNLIEDGMENEIDQDELVPIEIIDLLSRLHSELEEIL